MGIAEAAPVTSLINTLLLVIAKVLEWIIYFIGRLVILIVDVVIQVAQYNHFVNSAPVNNGWPLVRDVTNMFFIVLLLVIAFGTIVQYERLHYRNILPKLLLMAVLVNFSKTLIGLLIDFSQVLMLTFVNGFKAAAGGNFVEALKLNKIMTLTTTHDQLTTKSLERETPNDPFLVKLVIAEMLAIFFLGITIVMLLIMLVYLLVRIVGLWIALILSPFAFFATALPNFLAQKISGVTQGYWEKLGAFLSGGPMMAFFLWLTLATVQGEGFGKFTSEEYAGAAETESIISSETGFASAVGNVEDVATFFVAIIMMLMGIEAAINIGSSVSKRLGSFAGKIKDVGVKGARFAAYGGLAAGGALAARGAYRAGRWGARRTGRGAMAAGGAALRGIDQRWRVTERGGRAIQSAGLAVGAPGVAEAGARIRGVRGRAVTAERERYEKATAGLSMPERMRVAERGMSSKNTDRARAMTETYLKGGMTKDGFNAIADEFEEDGRARNLEGQELEAYKRANAEKKLSGFYAEYYKSAEDSHDEDRLKWASEQLVKNPHLAKNPGAFVAEQMIEDQNYYRKISPEAWSNADVVGAYIQNSGDIDGNEIDKKSNLGKLMKSNTFQGKAVKEYIDRVNAAKGEGVTLEEALKDKDVLQETNLVGGRFVRGKKSEDPIRYVEPGALAVGPSAEAQAAAIKAPERVRSESVINAGKDRLEAARERLASVRTRESLAPEERRAQEQAIRSDMTRTQANMMMAGGRIPEVYDVDAGGTFGSEAERASFETNVQNLHEAGQTNVNAYSQVDMNFLNKNPKGKNEARSTFVQRTDVSDLRSAYDSAQEGDNRAALQTLGNMTQAIHTEGGKVKSTIGKHNAAQRKAGTEEYGMPTMVSEDVVTKAARDHMAASKAKDAEGMRKAEEELKNHLKAAGIKEKMGMEDAKALLKREQVELDSVLRNLKKHASRRTTTVVARERRPSERRVAREERRLTRGAEQAGGAAPEIEPPRPEPPRAGGTPPAPGGTPGTTA